MSMLAAVPQPRASAPLLSEALGSLRVTRFRFHFQAVTALEMPPYKGSTFRGALGSALRHVLCMTGRAGCDGCPQVRLCLYPQLFETERVDHGNRRYHAPPHPFVLVPPLSRRTRYQPGESFSCDLILFGPAVDALPSFVSAFQSMGRCGLGRGCGQCRLTSFEPLLEGLGDANPDGRPWSALRIPSLTGDEIWGSAKSEVRSAKSDPLFPGARTACAGKDTSRRPSEYAAVRRESLPVRIAAAGRSPAATATADGWEDGLTLRFETPTRLKSGGRLTATPSFPLIVERLAERLTVLLHFYHGAPADLDWGDLLPGAESVRLVDSTVRWHDWERYSNRQQTRMRLGGFLGSATYAGDIRPFLPLLTLGQWTHVGKGASFGLGTIESSRERWQKGRKRTHHEQTAD